MSSTPGLDINLGQDTILTEKIYNEETQVDNYIHLDIFTGSFFTTIALTITCIIFLFKQSTEYLSWIFGLILIVITPLTWIRSLYISGDSPYKMYVLISLFCGIILNFAAILMVIIYSTILNKRLQDYKINLVVQPGKSAGNLRINPNILDNYKKIKILFTTNLVLCIAIILNFFVYEKERFNAQPKKTNIETQTAMSKNIYWWHNIVKIFIKYLDNWIIRGLSIIPIHGFFKMFLLFCGGFLFFFFSFFVKLKTTYKDDNITDPYVQNLIKEFGYGLNGIYPANNFDIVDFPKILVETAGPVNFAALGSFFLTFAIFIIVSFFWNLIKLYPGVSGTIQKMNTDMKIPNVSSSAFEYIIIILDKIKWLIAFFIMFVPLYFIALGEKKDESSANIISQNFILFVLCFVLALLGTPFIFVVFELFGRIFNVSLAKDLFTYFVSNSCEGDYNLNIFDRNFKFDCKKRSIFTIILLLVSFFGVTFGIYGHGVNKNTGHWLSNNGDNKNVKLFVIIIMSLMVGWFFALHLKFNMFYFLYDCVMQPSRTVLFSLAPLTVVGLAITQIIIADLTSKQVGDSIKTDG